MVPFSEHPPMEEIASSGETGKNRDLEMLIGLLDRAVGYRLEKGSRKVGKQETENVFGPVEAFNEMFRFYRLWGAIALNHLNQLLANKSEKMNKGSVTRTYLRLDAICNEHDDGGRRAATVFVPLDDLKGYVKVQNYQFVDTDCPEVQEGVMRYLGERVLRPSNFIYSHLDERIGPGNRVKCDKHYAQFSPTSIARMVVDKVSENEKRGIEDAIIRELAKTLRDKKMIPKASKVSQDMLVAGLRNDLSAVLNVGEKGYKDLYSVFEHTRFFATVLDDVVRLTQPQDLEVLKYFEKGSNGNGKGKNKNGRNYGRDGAAVTRKVTAVMSELEKIVATHIKPPYEIFQCGVKRPESFAIKVLLAKLYPTIEEGFKDGSLNAYLRSRGLPEMTEREVKPRDLRDLFRMSLIVHGDSVSYVLRCDYIPAVPEEEERAQSRVYDRFFRLAGIPEDIRGSNIGNGKSGGLQEWRSLGTVQTKEGIVINLGSEKDVKDYILRRKRNNFAEIKAHAIYNGLGSDIPFEIQLMTNYMDTRNQIGDDANHGVFKAKNAALIGYCIKRGVISGEMVEATISVVSSALTV